MASQEIHVLYLAALRAAPFCGKHIIPEELRLDVTWFTSYAEASNGVVLLPPAAKKSWTIERDSSLRGGGAHSPTHFFAIRYPRTLVERQLNIAQLEALNLLAALKTLAPPEPHLYMIIINTDNTVSQQTLTSGYGRNPIVCACAREIWLFTASQSTDIHVEHKPGSQIPFADAFSRTFFDKAACDLTDAGIAQRGLHSVYVDHKAVLTPNL